MSTVPNNKSAVAILGVPLGYGASMAGVDMGPAALRVAKLKQRIAALGYSVRDLGDLKLDHPELVPEEHDKLKYVTEIHAACEDLAARVEGILDEGQIPVVLGGDHSIAIGSFAGVASHYRKKEATIGLIWFDAHADMNTPETTPSGNIHGMPLAALMGYGAKDLTDIAGFRLRFVFLRLIFGWLDHDFRNSERRRWPFQQWLKIRIVLASGECGEDLIPGHAQAHAVDRRSGGQL